MSGVQIGAYNYQKSLAEGTTDNDGRVVFDCRKAVDVLTICWLQKVNSAPV